MITSSQLLFKNISATTAASSMRIKNTRMVYLSQLRKIIYACLVGEYTKSTEKRRGKLKWNTTYQNVKHTLQTE